MKGFFSILTLVAVFAGMLILLEWNNAEIAKLDNHVGYVVDIDNSNKVIIVLDANQHLTIPFKKLIRIPTAPWRLCEENVVPGGVEITSEVRESLLLLGELRFS